MYFQYQIDQSDDILISYGATVNEPAQKTRFINRMVDILSTPPIYENNNDKVCKKNKFFAVKIITEIKDRANRKIPLIILFSDNVFTQHDIDDVWLKFVEEKKILETKINQEINIQKQFKKTLSHCEKRLNKNLMYVTLITITGLIVAGIIATLK